MDTLAVLNSQFTKLRKTFRWLWDPYKQFSVYGFIVNYVLKNKCLSVMVIPEAILGEVEK